MATNATRNTNRPVEELVKGNIFVWICGLLLTGYVSGLTSYEFIIRITDQERISSESLAQLRSALKSGEAEIQVLQDDISELKDVNVRLTSHIAALSGNEIIKKILGSQYLAYRSFDLKREIGADLSFGQCESVDCIKLQYVGTEEGDAEEAIIRVSLDKDSVYGLPARKGATFGVRTRTIDYFVVVEDDRIDSFRLGVGLRPGTADPQHPLELVMGGQLPENEPTTQQKLRALYEEWGVPRDAILFQGDWSGDEFIAAQATARADHKLVMAYPFKSG